MNQISVGLIYIRTASGLILDLSSPHNNDEHQSVNDLIDKDLCSLTYIKIDDAIKVIQEFVLQSGYLGCF
jgi:hypothetical protein